ncbi:nSTAND1 domain-containing NTPase [Actinoplanes sp. URMC 104]|uniref:nSTAND1 domain-containing NTPase n=1 Tax=Actinoplanes sp. URMC 104 TaxID=3423409 RepID=UPI003F1D00AE
MPLLFISYSRHDMAAAVEARERLIAAGFTCVFHDVDPEEGIPTGADWERTLWFELRRCSAVVFLSSQHAISSPWCLAELAVARSSGKPIFPVALDGALPPLLSDTQAAVATGGLPTAVQRLLAAMRRAGLDPNDSFAWDQTRPPYPGLKAFEEVDAAVFFGRKDQVQRLHDMLHPPLQTRGRVVAVVGPSGSGKSSLVRAGLLPKLRRDRQWLVVAPLDRDGPLLERLARGLARIGGRNDWRPIARAVDSGGAEALATILRDLRDKPAATAAILERPNRVLVVIDQAEELVTHAAPAESGAFLRLLHEAVHAGTLLWVVCTVRSEFLSAAPEHAVLTEFVDDSMLLGSLPPERLTDVIGGPARRAGLHITPDLIARIAADTAGGDALPLLAYTMRLLADRAGPGGEITQDGYDRLGGVVGALRQNADTVQEALTRQGLAEDILPTLAALAAVERTGEPIRRRVPLASFNRNGQHVLSAFVDARLVSRGTDANGDVVVEVTHEALLRQWEPLRDAIEASRADLRLETDLIRWAEEWRHAGTDKSFLLTGERLTAVNRWAEAHLDAFARLPDAREFVEASRRASLEERGERADQAAVWAQQLASRDLNLATAVAAAAVAELAPTQASVLTLWGLGAQPVATSLPVAHTAPVCSMVWMPDGRLRTLDEQGKVCTWMDGHRTQECRLSDPAMDRTGVLSRNGSYVVGATERNSAGVWRVDDETYLGGREAGYVDEQRLTWANDERFAISLSSLSVDVYTIEDSQPMHHVSFDVRQFEGVAFSADGDYLAIAASGQVRIYRSDNPTTPTAKIRLRGELVRMALAPAGKFLAVLARARPDRLGDGLTLTIHSGNGRKNASWHVDGIDSPVEWSPDGTTVAYVQRDDVEHYVELRKIGSSRMVHRRVDGNPNHLAWSRDGQQIAMDHMTGRLAVWMPDDDRLEHLPGGRLRVARWSGTSSAVAVTAVQRPVRIIDSQGTIRELPASPEGSRIEVGWSPDSSILAIADFDGMKIYSDVGKPGLQFGPQQGEVGAFDWAPDGSRIALSCWHFNQTEPTVVSLWSVKDGAMLKVMAGEPDSRNVAFCPDGRRIAGTTKDDTVLIWDAESGAVLNRWFVGAGLITALAWAPNGRYLAAGSHHDTHLWDTVAAAGYARTGYPQDVNAICWSPDSAYLAATDGQRVTICRCFDGRPLTALQVPSTAGMVDLCWTDHLTMTLEDGVVLRWMIPLDDPPTDLDTEARNRLTAEDRQRYRLPVDTDRE